MSNTLRGFLGFVACYYYRRTEIVERLLLLYACCLLPMWKRHQHKCELNTRAYKHANGIFRFVFALPCNKQ